MKKIFLAAALFAALCLLQTACGFARPDGPFEATKTPPPPDYSNLDNWAAHPEKRDSADRTPAPELKDVQSTSGVDVFFLHPTTLTGSKPNEKNWNGAVEDAALNLKTDRTTILYQASIFNGTGRVYAPRYRQAHLQVFYGRDKKSAAASLDLAYKDVEAAFDYYLKHWNKGRPFILAGHSQGARHAMYLLRDRIENTPLEKQMIAAYIVGWPVREEFFRSLKPCKTPDANDCYCTWRTFKRRYGLRKFTQNPAGIVCTNPITWTTTTQYAPASANPGGVIRPFNRIYPHITDAEVHNGVLLSRHPKFRGSFLFQRRNYHVGDMNLFYLNIRENAQLRVKRMMNDK